MPIRDEKPEEEYFECENCGYDKIKEGHKHCGGCGEELDWDNIY